MTDLSEAVHCDVIAALENWARWCNRVAECYPEGYACMSAEGKLWTPYRNADQSLEEKLEALREHQEPDELGAIAVERAVQGLDLPKRVAVRIHFVTMPERERHDMHLTLEQWDERRARIATRRAQWYFTPQTYREAVDMAIDMIEAAL